MSPQTPRQPQSRVAPKERLDVHITLHLSLDDDRKLAEMVEVVNEDESYKERMIQGYVAKPTTKTGLLRTLLRERHALLRAMENES